MHLYDDIRFCFTKLLGFLMVSIVQLWNQRGCLRRNLSFIIVINSMDITEIIENTKKGNM